MVLNEIIEALDQAPATSAPRPIREPANSPTHDRSRMRIVAKAPVTNVAPVELLGVEQIIKASRRHFDEGHAPRALQLLRFACEDQPAAECVWLARLEAEFLVRDAAGFRRACRRFDSFHPFSAHWDKIHELGRNLGLTDALISTRTYDIDPSTERWPCLPGWLTA